MISVVELAGPSVAHADALEGEHGAEVGVIGGGIQGALGFGQPNMINPRRFQGAGRESSASSSTSRGSGRPIDLDTMNSASAS